ncbi:unnamed protein product [Protopolystoma xenopodis]|uniref:RRM domain-containing protein n=1 Tax=Protopolystoma xenopodis TaxID=117903 RepID=A0A448WRU1_9PLAT|nr:unnamed protein product [Protopolystoma xenopodis]
MRLLNQAEWQAGKCPHAHCYTAVQTSRLMCSSAVSIVFVPYGRRGKLVHAMLCMHIRACTCPYFPGNLMCTPASTDRQHTYVVRTDWPLICTTCTSRTYWSKLGRLFRKFSPIDTGLGLKSLAGLHIQAGDVASRFLSENSLVPVPCQALSGGSSNPPKFGTLIPNRIFVGGIPSNTTEQELKNFFSTFGQIKDVKIINDRLGASKGSYGFVTFESQEMAEKIIKNEVTFFSYTYSPQSETLIFKDRKLNIGHAIRKQQVLPRTDIPAALFFTGSAMAPYGLQNGMAVYPMSGQDYPLMAQVCSLNFIALFSFNHTALHRNSFIFCHYWFIWLLKGLMSHDPRLNITFWEIIVPIFIRQDT